LLTLNPSEGQNGNYGYNTSSNNPYIYSKIKAEQLMDQLRNQYKLNVVTIIPAAMIGPNCFGHITPSMEFLQKILNNKLPFNPGFYFNYVSITEVAHTAVAAMNKGVAGEKYILAQEQAINATEVFTLANQMYTKVKIPALVPRTKLMAIALIAEFVCRIFKIKPIMTRENVRQFLNNNYGFDIQKSKRDLGFNPRPYAEILQETFNYLQKQ